TVATVDPAAGGMSVRVSDGTVIGLSREETGRDRLDYGYAVTVHRAQGATVDLAHRLEDGGGRELAYVALSRARHRTTVHLAADTPDQAIEQLRDLWSRERRPRW